MKEKYDMIFPAICELRVVRIFKKYGYIDEFDNEICPIMFDDCTDFDSGYAWVCVENKWAIINTKGKLITELKYSKNEIRNRHNKEILKFIRKEKIKSLSL